MMPGACSRNELRWLDASVSSVVQLWPRGTYCRSSSQIVQRRGCASLGGYCVPQAVQMNACMEGLLVTAGQGRQTTHIPGPPPRFRAPESPQDRVRPCRRGSRERCGPAVRKCRENVPALRLRSQSWKFGTPFKRSEMKRSLFAFFDGRFQKDRRNRAAKGSLPDGEVQASF